MENCSPRVRHGSSRAEASSSPCRPTSCARSNSCSVRDTLATPPRTASSSISRCVRLSSTGDGEVEHGQLRSCRALLALSSGLLNPRHERVAQALYNVADSQSYKRIRTLFTIHKVAVVLTLTMPASRLASQPPPTSRLATQLGSPASPATARQPADMLGSRPTRGTTPLRQLQPLPRAVQPGAGTSGAGGSDDLPPSRIPAAFHVYAGRRRVFPSERPSGDAESLHLANALGGMLEQWRAKLEASKPSFPMGSSGSTLWGVVQMIVYDIWSTIEESRIWDTALLETQRQVCFYSPQLAAMLGRVRARIAQSFESILSMSQRLQYELQRWHAQWVHAGESLKQESSLRHGLQLQTGQLQAKVKQLENDGRIASVSSTHPPQRRALRLALSAFAMARGGSAPATRHSAGTPPSRR